MRIIDISSNIEEDKLFIGQKLPKINFKKSIKKGNPCNISEINYLENHLGSHIDFPFHIIDNGKRSGDYNLEKFYGKCFVVDISSGKSLKEILKDINLKNKTLLIKFYNENINFSDKYKFLTTEEIDFIIKKGIKNIGIDSFSIDGFGKKDFLNHKKLFKNDILIYEGLNLSEVKQGEYFFIGLPLKINGLEACLVRAILIVS